MYRKLKTQGVSPTTIIMNVPYGKTFMMFSRVKTLFWQGICTANSRHFIATVSSETILRDRMRDGKGKSVVYCVDVGGRSVVKKYNHCRGNGKVPF